MENLNDSEILQVYADMHMIFPDDLHITRPLVRMLEAQDDIDGAREIAIRTARRMLARGRPGDTIGFLEMCKRLKHPDSEEIEALGTMARITADVPMDMETGSGRTFTLIDQLSDMEARDFFSHGKLRSVKEGEHIVKQGEVSRSFFLILEGSMQVHMDVVSGHHMNLSMLEPGNFFGEFACVYQLPRSATVTATEPGLLLEFSDRAITELMQISPIAGERLMRTVQIRLVQSMSYGHPAFAELPETDRRWLAEESRLMEFRDGATIARDGELTDRCCVMIHGQAIAHHKRRNEHLEHPIVTGDMFGDINTYLRLPHETVVRAQGRCLICSIPKKVFNSFINAYGRFEHWVQKHGSQRQQAFHTHNSE